MNPIITEQIEKFKTGDFSGYESFYNETVNTVYTMLQTIVNDQNVATSLVPQVYDQIYKNTETLEQTEGFYQWAAEFANAEALGYLQENHLTGTISSAPEYEGKAPTADLQSGSEQAEITEQFYDYAAEDAALTITETEVADASFVTKLQEIVQTLSPIERVVFQEYYYFGVGVPEIAAKTGCKDADIRYTLSRTRTSILQAIMAFESAPKTADNAGGSGIGAGNLNIQNPDVQNADERRYHLSEAPWLWIAYQNYLGYTLGIDTASIAGWSLGVFGQAAGMAGVEGAVAGTGGAAGAGAAAGGASGIGGVAAAVIGSIGGKIALGVIGAALVTSIGFGVHHVVANQDREGARQDKAPTVTEVVETTEETEATTETEAPTTEETAEVQATSTDAGAMEADNSTSMGSGKIDTTAIAQKESKKSYKEFMSNIVNQGSVTWSDGSAISSGSIQSYAVTDIDNDSISELLLLVDPGFSAGMRTLVYRYDKDAKSVKSYFSTSYNSTFYDSGYIQSMDMTNTSKSAMMPYTVMKIQNGGCVAVWYVSDCRSEFYGSDFPADQDKDGDGLVYLVHDANSYEPMEWYTVTTYMDQAEYDAFVAGFGNARTVNYQDFTANNINALK